MKQWFDRAVIWMGTHPNSWRVLIAINLAVAAVFGALAIFVEQSRWVTLFYAVFAGFNVGQAANARQMMMMREAFNRMAEAYHAMHELNGQLMHNKFEAVILRPRTDDDDVPIAPGKMN